MKRIYVATFNTQKNRIYKTICFICWADNAKQAEQETRGVWKKQGHKPYQFHLHAVRSRFQEEALQKVVNWKGQVIRGRDCMNSFICVDLKEATWG